MTKMREMKEISIIIPFKGSLQTLPRLFDSIPKQDNIEIILVENSDTPLTKEQIGIDRDYILLDASENRYAGGARNTGIEASSGKWLIFADADDFFSNDAFNILFQYVDSAYDLIYFGCDSVFDDTLHPSDRHIPFNNILQKLKDAEEPEIKSKLDFVVPWAKMVRTELVKKYTIRFDEVIAANDIMFSVKCAYHSNNFTFNERHVYVVTTRKGSLANRWNEAILTSRFMVGLRRNRFLKDHSLDRYQVSVMIYLFKALKMNFGLFLKFIIQAITYRQNIFIGYRSWINTYISSKTKDNAIASYIERG